MAFDKIKVQKKLVEEEKEESGERQVGSGTHLMACVLLAHTLATGIPFSHF